MKRVLTYSSDGRWRKQISGRVHYFGRGKSKLDSKSYREAEERYFEFLAERESAKGIQKPISDLTLGDFGEKFLEGEFARYERREISAARFEKLRISVSDFVGFLGSDRPLVCVCEMDLHDYRNRTLALPVSTATNKQISVWTAKSRLDIIKLLIRWGYRHALIDRLPRNLNDFSKVRLPPPTIATFSSDELASLYEAADERMRTWILLACNCGFGQADLANLRISELDLDAGRIIRDRTKTGVPTRFQLWPLTIAMLKKTGRWQGEPEDRVFLTCRGNPLVHERFEKDKMKKSDAVRSAFSRLTKQLEINGGRGFYTIRKTAASEIEKIDPAVTEMFLGHSEHGLKRFYAERNWNRLDTALRKLRHRFTRMVGDRS